MIEIERKFLVRDPHLFIGRQGGVQITQAYLVNPAGVTVRARELIDLNSVAVSWVLTLKGKSADGGLSRLEWETPIPAEVFHLIKNSGESLTKRRHKVDYEGYTWEVDVLDGPGCTLVVAEVEAPTVEAVQGAPLPAWVGREVTGDPRFRMSRLTTGEAVRTAYDASLYDRVL